MFKSAETLRLAAEMRALQKVASPWREARTTWFDGTPESIEARLASTERVLSFARAGMTTAHMALEREAATARAELKEASHRLMIDFLDDSARVAGKHDADPDEPWKNKATGEDTPTEHWENLHLSPFDDEDDYEGKHRESNRRVAADYPLGPGYDRPGFGPADIAEYEDHLHEHNYHTDPTDRRDLERRLRHEEPDFDDPARYSRRTAAPMTSVGEGGSGLADMGTAMMSGQGGAVSTSLPGAIAKGVWNGSTTTGQEPTPAFNPGPKAAGLRLAAAAFIDAQNTRDRDELALRAARHVAGMTGQLPRPVAEAAGRVFVAAVLAGCDSGKDQNCEDCGADAGENCRPWCTGEAAHEDEKADRKKKSHRTAAVLTDFPDELMF